MKIAAAQVRPEKGNIPENIKRHIKLIEMALAKHADAIFFPELSLTGYEPELAKDLAMQSNDARLDVFQELSNQHDITIGIGAPIKVEHGIQIGMVIFQPEAPRRVYAKQLLHEDEEPYFVSGHDQTLIKVKGKVIMPSICYESLREEHYSRISDFKPDLYLASVAKDKDGVEKANRIYPDIAKKYDIPVLMANSVGPSDNFVAAGGSAAWSADGRLVGDLNEDEESIIIFDA